jgi:hypothetical protein
VIGFILAFVLLFIALGIPAYALNSVRRARKFRRQQVRLSVAYDRTVHARERGLPPLLAGAGLLSGQTLRTIDLR